MDMRKDLIVKAMTDALDAKNIVERNEAPVRRAEGLDLTNGVMRGDKSTEAEFEVAGVKFEVDLLHAQKTGFYLDQRQNYEAVARFAKEKRVLDCFTSQGAFALGCARAGAKEVTAVEASSENIAAAKKNAKRNKLSVQWIEQDVFQFLRAAEKEGANTI